MSQLILVGGLPGSGKTFLAETLWQGLHVNYSEPMIVSADDFFYLEEGETICGEAVRADPFLLKGGDFYRERVKRSVDSEGFSYRFERELQSHAHVWCQEQVRNSLARSPSTAVVVHNTFTQRWEIEPYLQLARSFDARFIVTRLHNGGVSDEELAYRNTHRVPLDIIVKMKELWEEDWHAGNPIPPWDRVEEES